MTDQTPLNSIQFRKISPKFEKFPPSSIDRFALIAETWRATNRRNAFARTRQSRSD